MKKVLFFSLVVLTMASGCRQIFAKRISGSGSINTETRQVGSFNGVDVSGAIDVVVSPGEPSVKIEGDNNLLEYIEVYEEQGMLKIHNRKGVNLKPTRSMKVYVSNPSFQYLEASGACNIKGQGIITSSGLMSIDLSGSSDVDVELDAPDVEVELSGAGTIQLAGKTRNLTVDGSGATKIKCFDLLAENVRINISGAGDAEVFASVSLDVDVSGASDVRYRGNASVKQDISGAGSVKKAE